MRGHTGNIRVAVLVIVPVKKSHGWPAVKRESQQERKREMDLHKCK